MIVKNRDPVPALCFGTDIGMQGQLKPTKVKWFGESDNTARETFDDHSALLVQI